MKCVIAAINAKYIHSNLAIYCLKSYAKKYGEEVSLLEFTINQSKEEILRGVYRSCPDMLCISCYIWNISIVRELVRELHKIMPDLPIWLGGPEVSYDAEKVLNEEPSIRGVLCGEGEETFLELLCYYRRRERTLEQIPGIAWRTENGEIRINEWRMPLDLSEIPFPYEDLSDFQHRIIYYESSRGCPFSCSYCLSSIDKKLRFRNLDLVRKELQFFLDHRVPQVKFVDRTFNCKHEHAQEIWHYIKEHDNGITNFHFEISADLLTEEELELFRTMRPGLIQLEIGVQSTNPDTIREIHRTMKFDRVAEVVKTIGENRNIHQHLDLIAGLPYEDYSSFRKSFADVYALRPQQLQLGFLKVLKGSYLCENAEKYGCVHQEKEPYEVLFTNWLPYEDVLRLKQVEEMTEIYYNSGQFEKLLAEIEKQYENPFDFYQELGSFYERKGYWGISHNRLRRYEILLEFLKEKDPGHERRYRKLAVLDVYARENAKSRPDFAESQEVYKDLFRNFYQREERERVYLPEYRNYDWKQIQKMTHLEAMEEEGVFVLFDYKNRDPLTNSARMIQVYLKD